MCGIAGILNAAGAPVEAGVLRRMTERLVHRGPDDEGTWISSDGRAGLGHRRLSVIDLSPAGHQPMASASGRFVVTYNGEVYNFSELRAELERDGARFRGHSDTEVVLACLERWGVEGAVSRFIGMFAFAAWDAREERLHLVRDRMGIKPLYYGDAGGAFVFASELRALCAHPGVRREVCPGALTEYLRYGYVPGPRSIFRGVKKLPPGCILAVRPGGGEELRRYWDIREVARAGLSAPPPRDETQALDELEDLLADAVRRRMVADVPLGAFLSGGIDSSTVVALMQAQSPRPVHSFSIGFREQAYDEAVHAAAVARHLGTRHTELYVTDRDARDVIPEIPQVYDEPFADASQIPTCIVSRLARREVTVVLSGDGGDELFGGYNRYLFVSRYWRWLAALPRPPRRLAGADLSRPAPGTWSRVLRTAGAALPPAWIPALPGEKVHKLASVLAAADIDSLHRMAVSQWHAPERIVRGGEAAGADEPFDLPGSESVLRQMCHDARTYLVDDILTKLDRASMRVSLEARVPLLDHRVVEAAWRLPVGMKFRNGQGKWALRQILHRHVPPEAVERPKMGFSVPIAEWLRGPLRDWAEACLDPARLAREGYLDPEAVQETWRMHLSGRVDRAGAIWTVLMFQTWLDGMRRWD